MHDVNMHPGQESYYNHKHSIRVKKSLIYELKTMY